MASQKKQIITSNTASVHIGLYTVTLLFVEEAITFCTSLLAEAIAAKGIEKESDPFGSERSSLSFK